MQQLGELRSMHDQFLDRNVAVVAISNEERNIMGHAETIGELGFMPAWAMVTDIGYKHDAYERTTAYFVDEQGIVRQVFPMEIYDRPPWWAILNEIDRLDAETEDQAGKSKRDRKAKRARKGRSSGRR